MSRIGYTPISIPHEVTITFEGSAIMVAGPKGTLKHNIHPAITVKKDNDSLTFTPKDTSKLSLALHGLTRSVIANLVQGVTQEFSKRLELIGTGYRVIKQGDSLNLQLGFSHPVEFTPPAGITFEVEGTNKIIVKGADKQLVGEISAQIRATKKPEPYKGKGIRYEGEVVRRKAGKAAKVGAAA